MKPTKQIKKDMRDGVYRELLKDIYEDDRVLDYQEARYAKAIEKFEELYGEQEVEIYSAPGRSEIGGNHTDHQHGQVLAAGINLDAIAIAAKTEDKQIKIVSDHFDIKPVDLSDLEKKEEETGTSEALVRGVAYKLQKEGFKLGGVYVYMTSDVLVGAGLSSSAAFEVAVCTVISGLYNEMKISSILSAQVSQYAENVYFGKPCGLMDQMASSVGSLVNIDFKDTKDPVVNRLDVDFGRFAHSLCIVDTKGDHTDLTNEYAYVPQEMKKVAAYFDCEYLREVDEEQFYRELPNVRKTAGDRGVLRAIHFFGDNRRVGEEVEALQNGEFEKFKELVTESGDSSYKYLQNVFANCDVQNQSVSLGLALSERILGKKGACRVHGGGFAGTIQAFVPDELVAGYKEQMEYFFGKDSCHVLKIRKYGGMKVLG
ncbi:MAG TPA: galactokinase family protein [Lachnospiraceae bacterium]|nr:galactokinase family protein [Lachnospiraceae bacterium]